MIRTTHQFCVAGIRQNGRLLHCGCKLPGEMPNMRGGYRLVAVISGKTWQFGQIVHDATFYQELLSAATKGCYQIDGLYSIHPVVLQTVPRSDLVHRGD